MKDKRVAIVNDVINAGSAVRGTWSAQQRYAARGEQLGLLAHVVPQWTLALMLFMAILGSSGWLLDQHLLKPWLLVNVIVAYLHYAYDGLIWRQRT